MLGIKPRQTADCRLGGHKCSVILTYRKDYCKCFLIIFKKNLYRKIQPQHIVDKNFSKHKQLT